ncbi:LexA family protein [Pedobacter deserti]|uniref:LexA family protein n=1 Tax=Pedobacter deserti TaxID=2817382 RepID=UPI00210C73C6|nr:translesion error-prone DNA polymerase V autoproteolytic subunit [Pedobacter sp. SYSU D00382]
MKEITLFKRGAATSLIPLFAEKVNAGFESPAADYEEARIDLNDYVSRYPEATFFAKVEGDCMIGSGIFPDDLLVVDRSLNAQSGDVVVGTLNGEFVLRSFFKKGCQVFLMPDNKYYKPIELTEHTKFEIWGVVPYTIYNQRRRNGTRVNRFEQLLR